MQKHLRENYQMGNTKYKNKVLFVISSFKAVSLNLFLGVEKENTSKFQGNPNQSSEISH